MKGITLNFSRPDLSCAPRAFTFSSKLSSSNALVTAMPAAHAKGFPPYVEAWSPGPNTFALSLQSMAPMGTPPPRALAHVNTSGSTFKCWKPHSLPVRPTPVCTYTCTQRHIARIQENWNVKGAQNRTTNFNAALCARHHTHATPRGARNNQESSNRDLQEVSTLVSQMGKLLHDGTLITTSSHINSAPCSSQRSRAVWKNSWLPGLTPPSPCRLSKKMAATPRFGAFLPCRRAMRRRRSEGGLLMRATIAYEEGEESEHQWPSDKMRGASESPTRQKEKRCSQVKDT